tara:strand:- start:19364 stop:21628 length:2265 start_codon:yes stop_codon:yes gene_type:complete
MKKTVFLSCLIYTAFTQAQSLRVGEWRDHLSYKYAYDVCEVGNSIYVSTDRALFEYNTVDNSIERINTLNKLSDTGVSSIGTSGNLLIVVYDNGNVDLIRGNTTVNLPDIKNASLIADKRVNHINIDNNIAYLSCGFGIVVLDLDREEVKDTYFIGEYGAQINVLSTSLAHNSIYAATNKGLYRADIYESNLADYNSWEKLPAHSRSRVDLLESFNGLLFVNLHGEEYNTDTLYHFDGNNWVVFEQESSNVSIKANSQELVLTTRFNVSVYDQGLNRNQYLYSGQFNLDKIDFNSAIFTDKDEFWIADKHNGLLHNDGYFFESIKPSGPFLSDAGQIINFGDEILVAHGAKSENWDPRWHKSELSILKKDDWTTSNVLKDEDFIDIVAVNKRGPTTYLASFHKGLAKMTGLDLDVIYNETNSSLQKRAVANPDWIEIGAIQFDSEGNLWCTNSQTYEPLSVKYTNGDWESFSLGSGVTETQDLAKLLIDKNDQKWIQLKNNGLIVFDESRQGIKSIKLTNSENAGNLVSNRVHSFAEDLEGEIWVGTDNGVSVFYDSNSIFQGANASQIVVTLGEYNSYLLEGQQINDIEIDGANRKWFATNNSGVVVTSANGTDEIHHFTSENSPLFSNKVLDIEMNDVTGEVFFATEKGLTSLRSESSKGNADFSDVLVFPNPVKPDYSGPITIKGLITDAVVKITDISGNLIYETIALGGQAVWDGKSFDGQKAHTGVYLVFCSDQEGTISHVTKLLFVRG